MSNRVRLDIAIIVLASPNKSALCFHSIGNHVIDQPMLVPDVLGLKLGLVLGLIDLLEDILEAPIIFLQDGVLCAEVERPALLQRKLK